MGKSTIKKTIFNSYVCWPEGISPWYSHDIPMSQAVGPFGTLRSDDAAAELEAQAAQRRAGFYRGPSHPAKMCLASYEWGNK